MRSRPFLHQSGMADEHGRCPASPCPPPTPHACREPPPRTSSPSPRNSCRVRMSSIRPVMSLGARVRGVYQHPPSLPPLGGHRVDERALLRVELLLRRPKSSLTVAATNIGDGSEAPNPFNVRLNARAAQSVRLLHSMRQWRRPSPAPGAALRKFLCGVAGPARSAPAVRPSAQPFSPPPRSTARSAHQPMWPNRLPAGPPPMPDPRRCP